MGKNMIAANSLNGIPEIPNSRRIEVAAERLLDAFDLLYAIKDGLDQEEEEGEEEREAWHQCLQGFHCFITQALAILTVKAEHIEEIWEKIESGELFEHFMKSDIPEGLKKLFSK